MTAIATENNTGNRQMSIERIPEFLTAIRTAKVSEHEKLTINEVNYLRASYELSSLKRALTRYRNTVKQSVTDNVMQNNIIKHLVLTDNEKEQLAIAANEQLNRDLRNLRPINDIDTYIDKAEKMLGSASYIAVIAGLCALTGRRAAEIGCSARFERIEGDDTGILFSGQLKTKGRGELPSYRIPVLGNVTRILTALNQLRTNKADLIDAPVLFHDRCSKSLSETVKKQFQGVSNDKLSPKDLRSIYAEICFYYNADVTIAKSKYMSSILGHDETDNTTGLSYVDFYIVEND